MHRKSGFPAEADRAALLKTLPGKRSKPYRMRLRGHRVQLLRSEAEEREYRQWLAEYEERSGKFSTCRLVEQIGQAPLPEAVLVHDKISRADSGLKLA